MNQLTRRSLKIDVIWVKAIFFLLVVKLSFSYLQVDLDYWTRHYTSNFDKYNFLGVPKNLSGMVEYILLPLLFIFVFKNYNYLGRLKAPLFISILLLLLNLVTSLINNLPILKSLESSLKLISPVFFFMTLIIYKKKFDTDLKKIMIRLLKFCIFLIVIGLVFFDPVANRIEERLPIYFNNIHTHNYIITAIFIGYSYIIFRERSTTFLLFFLIPSFLFLYLGYAVRTALVLYLVYIIGLLFIRIDYFKYLLVQILIFVPLFLFLGYLVLDLDLNKLSSGRLSMYEAKIEMIKNFNVIEILFGKGAGSDLIDIDVWWGERGSHSDFITYIVENGILYMFGFVLFVSSLIPLFKKVNIVFLSIIIGYFFSSLISNGLAIRPLAGYVFFTVLAYIYYDIYLKLNYHNE